MTTPSALHVRPIEAGDEADWDSFVEASPQGTIFHTTAWKQAMDVAYDPEQMLLLGCFDGAQLVGGCACLVRRRWGIEMAVMPLLTPYGGFLLPAFAGDKLSDRTSRQREILVALSNAMGERFRREELIMAPGLDDPRALGDEAYRVSSRFTYHIDLRLTDRVLWNRLDGHVRRQIRKADKLNVEPCSADGERAFAIFQETFKRRGEPCPVSRALFHAVFSGEALTPFREVIAVRHEGRLASFVVILRFGGTLYYALASTTREAMPTGLSSYLIWQILRANAGAAADCHTFDFVGANIPTIARFKEGFNPSLISHWKLERSRGVTPGLLSAVASMRKR